MVDCSFVYFDVRTTLQFITLGEESIIDPMFGDVTQIKFCSFVKWLPPAASRVSGNLDSQFIGKPAFLEEYKVKNGDTPDFPLTKTTPFRGMKSSQLIQKVIMFLEILELKIGLIGENGDLSSRSSVMAPSRCFLAPDKGAVRLTLALT